MKKDKDKFERRKGYGLLNMTEVATMCGIPRYTFEYLTRSGEIDRPTHILLGGRWRYYTQDEAAAIVKRVEGMKTRHLQ